MALRRRDLFIAAGALAVAASVSPFLRYLNSGFEFVPIAGLDGFRRLDQGPVSSGPAIFLGLETPADTSETTVEALRRNPCHLLFGSDGWHDGRLPIAIFNDYYCPYCATLSRRLRAIAEEDGRIDLVFHELPLLGPRSVQTARIALAAGQQGAHGQAHARLMETTLRPGPAGLAGFAGALDLDADRLATDEASNVVTHQIERSAAIANALGIIGTPATMIGRTLVIGAISAPDIKRLIDLERAEGRDGCR